MNVDFCVPQSLDNIFKKKMLLSIIDIVARLFSRQTKKKDLIF